MNNSNRVVVMVVDDSKLVRESVAGLLELNGYSVCQAEDGQEALERIESEMPHCVIFDVMMPRMTGLKFSQEVRARFGDDIVLVAMSGYPAQTQVVNETFAVADHYFQKPFDLSDIEKILPPL